MEKLNDFKTILINVDEEILEKNLEKFINTSLKLKGIKTKINENIFYSFIKELNSYQITIFKTNKFYFFNLEKYIKEEGGIYTLFIYNNYLILYKNKKLYYYQYLKYRLSNEQIQEYFFKRFNLSTIRPIYLNSLYSQEHINFDLTIKFKYIFLLAYTLLFSCSLFFLLKSEDLKKEEINLYKEKQLLSKQLVNLFDDLTNLDIKIKSLNFNQEEFKVVLYSNKQANIYKFINTNKKHFNTKKVFFNEKSKNYELFGNIYTTRE